MYQHCKQDTNAVASWLASTARAYGYPGDPLASGSWDAQPLTKNGRLNGISRTQQAPAEQQDAVKSPKYIVALRDFLPLAKFITGKLGASASVPDAFVHAIDRLITTRFNFGTRLAEHGARLDQKADANHGHFVGTLEEVRDTLRRCVPSTVDSQLDPRGVHQPRIQAHHSLNAW